MKIIFIPAVIVCCLVSVPGKSQSYFNVVSGDSVQIYYNSNHNLSDKSCSRWVRATRVDAAGLYQGAFEDYSKDSILLAQGNYKAGFKNGQFRIYHKNGKVARRGSYRDGKPSGVWHFYHDNGVPERTLEFRNRDTLMIQYVDPAGNVLVDDGKGNFRGLVAGLSQTSYQVLASGEVAGGKPQGKWTGNEINNPKALCQELFDHGKLISGKFPNAKLGGSKPYTEHSYLNSFFTGSYLDVAELMQVESCTSAEDPFEVYLTKSFDKTFDRKVFETLRMSQLVNTTSVLTVSFAVNEYGEAVDFHCVNTLFADSYPLFVRMLKKHSKFAGARKKIYFHMRAAFIKSFDGYKCKYELSETEIPSITVGNYQGLPYQN